MNALELIEYLDEIRRLEVDLAIHRKYREVASQSESEINEALIMQTMRKLGELKKIAHYAR